MRTIAATLLGVIIGLAVGVGMFDHGPGIEPAVLVVAVTGGVLGLVTSSVAVGRQGRAEQRAHD